MKSTVRGLFAFAMLLTLGGCGDDGDGVGTGSLTLKVVDAPVDGATAVVVAFSGVELKPASGPAFSIDFASPREIDLIATQGGNAATLLDDQIVPAGPYAWIRLKVNSAQGVMDSYIEFPGEQFPLYVPSGAETGLKLVRGFTMPQGGAADFTLDFDLRKSVVLPSAPDSSYILRPALRLVDNAQVGTVVGTVFPELLTAGCAAAVYIYSGADVTPVDIDGVGDEPLASVTVGMDGQYSIPYLPAGAYTVAFTCDADQDDPEATDNLGFGPVINATVTVGETTTVDFEGG
ncbi:MAG: DUF4382 domain-containing protein [Gammaproteobacteria bacterium]